MRILAAAVLILPSLSRAQFGTPSETVNTVANVLSVAANVSQAASVDVLANVFGNASNVASEGRLKASFRHTTVASSFPFLGERYPRQRLERGQHP